MSKQEKFAKLCRNLGIKPEIAFIGGGNIAKALISGFILSDIIKRENISISVKSDASAFEWKEKGFQCYTTNDKLLENHEKGLVFLCVKPNSFDKIVPSIHRLISRLGIIISVIAGLKLEKLYNHLSLSEDCPIIRLLPNTAAKIGFSVSAISTNSLQAMEYVNLVTSLMESVGICELVPETQIDAVCALGGSAIAFIYTIIESLSDAGVSSGLSRTLATKMAVQTMLVCSPDGTTIAGIRVLEKAGLRSTLIEAVIASKEKAEQLGRQ